MLGISGVSVLLGLIKLRGSIPESCVREKGHEVSGYQISATDITETH